jgi:integrase
MARVYFRDGQGWYIDFRHKGRRYRELAGKDIIKTDAEQFLAKRQREVQREGIYDKQPEPVPFSTYADQFIRLECGKWKSRDRVEGIMEMFKAYFKKASSKETPYLSDITTEMIKHFKAEREEDRSDATVLKELTLLKFMFKTAVESKPRKLAENPMAGIKMPKVQNSRVRFVEQDELKCIFRHLDERQTFHDERTGRTETAPMRPFFAFLRFTAARRGEALNLCWNDIDLKRETMTYRTTKNGETDVTVPMNRTVKAILEALPTPIDRSQPVFEMKNSPTNWMRIQRAWKAACTTAKVEDFHVHDLRHQAATDLRHAGVDLGDVKEFLRHKGMTMTLRYAHIKDERKKATAAVLDTIGTTAKRREKIGH